MNADRASRQAVWTESTHTFFYDGWNLVQETSHDQQSTITNTFVSGKDLSGSLQGAGGVGGLLAVCLDGAWNFPFYDNNGNISEYVTTNGTVVAHYELDAFGRTLAQSRPLADAFPHRFSTKYLDSETGLYYYGYRFYAPELGRWLSRDPIEEEGGLNLYGFCGNDGVGCVDPLGRELWVVYGDMPETANTVETWNQTLDESKKKVKEHIANLSAADAARYRFYWWALGSSGKKEQTKLSRDEFLARIEAETAHAVPSPFETLDGDKADVERTAAGHKQAWDMTGYTHHTNIGDNTVQYKQGIEQRARVVAEIGNIAVPQGKLLHATCSGDANESKPEYQQLNMVFRTPDMDALNCYVRWSAAELRVGTATTQP